MTNLKKLSEDTFRAAQSPAIWLLTAERLRDGAEAILTHEQAFEVSYFQAHSAAVQEAMAIAYSEGNDSGVADIKARAPNYPAAQLLYGYALENLLKGIWVAKDPSLISSGKLNRKLASHDVVKLAKQAGFVLHTQEVPVAQALSRLSVWAGRYPVALLEAEFASTPNADELLDYGSRHPIVKAMYARGHAELTALLPKPISNRHGAVVVFRQPGT
ncbi:hypothetical protein HU230_0043350 (plasmid) [Bradyrhizobium quebecense]|uniref:HEPN domain-containing protein n=1 Tax=Bradyrhizobium quebecense TaxID=2748629 RepID=A0A973WW07_9BRAD|nr:hypothetical protein [Bradyrhizobium quebecense]UGA49049.1 hypothetical protein HU230_0043350 [Bradyrhizobium quebecense]